MLILRDKNSVLILCIIVVAVFFLSRVVLCTKVGLDLTPKVLNVKERVTHRTLQICCCFSLFRVLCGLQAARIMY